MVAAYCLDAAWIAINIPDVGGGVFWFVSQGAITLAVKTQKTEVEKAEKPAKKLTALEHVSIGSYKGNPMIQFHKGKENADQYPFQFGPGKARTLLKAIEVKGIDAVLAKLREVAAHTGDSRE